MTGRVSAKRRKAAKPLYHGAKISAYQFKRALWYFTLDVSAREAAQQMDLSANSIGAIWSKLRRFFYDHGLFRNVYRGGDPKAGLPPDAEDVELAVLTYHLGRVGQKRGQLDARPGEPDLHFAESNWRLNFEPIMRERGAEATHKMMYAQLLEFMRQFGPVGKSGEPRNEDKLAGRRLALDQLERLMLWYERSSTQYRDPDGKAALRSIRMDDAPERDKASS